LVLAFSALAVLRPLSASALTTRYGETWRQIENLEKETLKLGVTQGRLPASRGDLIAALGQGEAALQDSWGQSLVYLYPAVHGEELFDLYSIGVNGIDEGGGGDDISNFHLNLGAYSKPTILESLLLVSIVDLPIVILLGGAYLLIRRVRRPAA
jgi:hypothetical protein